MALHVVDLAFLLPERRCHLALKPVIKLTYSFFHYIISIIYNPNCRERKRARLNSCFQSPVRVFPQPLDLGADLIVSSTHKTLSGPQGGIILGKESHNIEQMLPALFPALVTNHHLMRIPAMIALFAEWKAYGTEYAKAIVENAITLANKLDKSGIPVVRTAQGPTLSHTILIKTEQMRLSSKQVARHLEDCGIIAGPTSLPIEHGGEGIRIGTQEVTRMGLHKEQIGEMAKLICDAISSSQEADIRKRVKEFTKSLQTVHYCHRHSV